MVGEERIELLEELISEVDPFNLNRDPIENFLEKSRGSPFAGLSVEELNRFVRTVKADYMLLYPSQSAKKCEASRARQENERGRRIDDSFFFKIS